VPYPTANAGYDEMICYDAATQLHGTIVGSSFTWTPASTLTGANTLDPAAKPTATTSYVLYAYDVAGCPKPGTDTVTITMLPEIKAFGGNDTAVVLGQPLQFNASGGLHYEWTPANNLSNSNIANPVGVYFTPSNGINYKVYVLNEAGCVDSSMLRVRVFQTLPAVFVPTGFTPNNDGVNDWVRPVSAGIQTIEYFRVFNRWGELVYNGNINGKGWDGNVNGKPQGNGVYVWMVKAKDYLGGDFSKSGTVTLIR
jgi:gliding motility-associated-like protein